jgi:hypothetical protein
MRVRRAAGGFRFRPVHGNAIMTYKMRSSLAALGTMLFVCGSAAPKVRKAQLPVPAQIIIGRRTFFDFGPPFNYYEVLSLRSSGLNTLIQRIRVTPSGDACIRPAKIESAAASINEALPDLLDHSRNIRMDVLDRDMFDPHPITPQHTSWTMALLRRLDAALGGSVLDLPAFTVS